MNPETPIQTRRIKQLEAEGYYVIRLSRTNKEGIPDLLAIPRGTQVLFSEVKQPGKKPSPLQDYRIKELQSFGFKVEIYDGSKEL
jgi:Holliday junction resolvase